MNDRYIYLLRLPEEIYKIGVAKNVDKRIKQLQTGSADEIVLIDKFLSKYPFKMETYFHNKYKENNVNGEWFYLTKENVNSFLSDCIKMENNFKCMDNYENPYM